jgi:hypothetical protein
VPEFVFEIKPDCRGWRLAPQGEAQGRWFESLALAERRARFLAVRQDVRGLATRIEVLDASSAIIGVWRGEQYSHMQDIAVPLAA